METFSWMLQPRVHTFMCVTFYLVKKNIFIHENKKKIGKIYSVNACNDKCLQVLQTFVPQKHTFGILKEFTACVQTEVTWGNTTYYKLMSDLLPLKENSFTVLQA